ncbi:MAG: MFS transporter [Coriobacteriia bacterium]|nr:MFS transporter [Coriobacteriia bacterium]
MTPANDPADIPRPLDPDSVGVSTLEADVEGPSSQIVRTGTTFDAFRHRDYSLFWSGALVSNVGSWMQMYALSIVVYAFRKSEADLGIVNALSGLPVLFLALPAGALADRVDRKQLLIWSQVAMGVLAVALGGLYVTGHLSDASPVTALAWVSAIGLLGGIMSALTFPAWQSMVPDLVPRETLLNAIALNAAQFQTARLLGPLAASGLLLLGAGMGDIFFVNAASFIFVIAALAVIRPAKHEAPAAGAKRDGAWKTLTAGLAYAAENRTVGVLILSTAMMTIFGMPYMMLLPAIADKALHGDKLLVSYLMAANGMGAVVGALVVASLPKDVRREPLVRYALLAMAVLLVAFALSRIIWLSLVFSALAGAAFLTSTSLMNTSIQSCVPNRLRGRVMALFVVSFMGLMPVSSIVFGPLGKVIGPTNAVIAGAVVLGIYALVLVARPGLLSPQAACDLDEGPGAPGGPGAR